MVAAKTKRSIFITAAIDGSKKKEMIRSHVREMASRFQAAVLLITVA
jgi:hypothetical protein